MPTPSVEIIEAPGGRRLIEGAASVTAFVGASGPGPADTPVRVAGVQDFEASFGPRAAGDDLAQAIALFFANGGPEAWVVIATGLQALDAVAGLSLLVLPGQSDPARQAAAVAYAEARGAFVILDLPATVTSRAAAEAWLAAAGALRSPNAAAYLPQIVPVGGTQAVANAGAVAGAMLRMELARGVWAAPSGMEATLAGVAGLATRLSQADMNVLAQDGLNPLRQTPEGQVLIWGARTLASGTSGEGDWKYIPVRRMALYLEQSVAAGLQWTVFEPNGPPLWAAVSLAVERFLMTLFRQGAFQGVKPDQAFYVRCDASTMTQADIDSGRLVAEIGVAPLRPAEFVIFRIGAWTAGSQGGGSPPPPPP
jgi:uncharacterized protein